uniref:PLAT domain-containing protein n=1 Tax=Acrobeloides nanus TaxID=290746 RepID=A0A914CMX7_9BILA
MLLRESAHTPYRYVLNQARVRPREQDDSPYVKELLVTQMEGLSTKISKKKAQALEKSHWVLSMSLGDQCSLLPKVTLCGEEGSAEMEILNTTPTDWIISYSLKNVELGLLRKVRVEVDQSQRLNVFPEEGDNPENHVFIKKMRLCDTANGAELRFPSANVELIQYSVYEFPAIWPDYPPIQNVLYDVNVNTGNCEFENDFKVHLNLFGEKGDIGYRLLSTDLLRPYNFEPDSQQSFEIEAVSIGEITTAEITVDSYESNFEWQCKEIVVTDIETSMFYIFNFSKTFTPENRRQNCSVSLLTDSL